jgi:hypothetical protein
MSLVTWNDVYQQLWMEAAQSRGTITSVGELPGVAHYSTLPEWPRTTGADAIAIASLVDPVLSATPLRPGGYGITRLWQTAVIEIESDAFPRPAAEYAHNRTLWSALLAVAAHLHVMDAPVPDDAAWEALLAVLWSPVVGHRNASNASDPRTRTLTAPTFESMWGTLQAELAEVRGFDLRDVPEDELADPMEVPRTTNADVVQLASYWSRALVRLQVQVMTGGVASPPDFEALQLEWQSVTADVDRLAARGKPGRVYVRNHDLWRAMRALATAFGDVDEPPAAYELVEPSAPTRTPASSPNAAAAPPAKPTDLSSRLADAADTVAKAIGNIAHDAGAGLVSKLGKPLLIGGAVAAGLILLLRATAPCDCDRSGAAPEVKAA